jgi:lipid-binding SYLF domain-containing protein
MKTTLSVALGIVTLAFSVLIPGSSPAANGSAIDRDVTATLTKLYKNNPEAKALGDRAVAVLVFPRIMKGAFIIAGQYGDGALRKNGKTVAYYRSVATSFGFQAGIQAYGYILFFMDDTSVHYLDKSDGWELGAGPTLVILHKGFGKNLPTTMVQEGVYALVFDQKGLMAGFAIEGSKITRINPEP